MSDLLIVVASPTAVPTILSVTDSQVLTLGSDAVLTCTFNGNPSPTVAWFKDGYIVRDGPKYSVSTVSDTVSTLTIRNVQPADLTSYQCHLSNKRGSSVREIFLCGQRKDMHVVCQVLFNHVSMTSVLPLPSWCSRGSDSHSRAFHKGKRAHHLGPSGRAQR